MNIWLLTVGEYSDYNVIGAFDDEHREEAEEIAKLIGGRVDCNKDEDGKDCTFKLNIFDRDEPPPGMKRFEFHMDRSEKISHTRNSLPLLRVNGKRHKEEWSLRTFANTRYERKKDYWSLFVSLYAKSETHAIKIANDLRAQLLAGNIAEPEIGYESQPFHGAKA